MVCELNLRGAVFLVFWRKASDFLNLCAVFACNYMSFVALPSSEAPVSKGVAWVLCWCKIDLLKRLADTLSLLQLLNGFLILLKVSQVC